MKFLIVNDNGESQEALRSFDKFVVFIKKSLFWDKSTCDDDTEIAICRLGSDLLEFLFEADSEFMNTDAPKRFDVMDAVFIYSSSQTTVWGNSNKKVIFFLRGNEFLIDNNFDQNVYAC